MNNPVPSPPRFIRIREVCRRLGISRASIYLRLQKGSRHYDPSFPTQVRLGPNTVAWLEAHIDAWVAQRVDAARGDELIPAKRSRSSVSPSTEALQGVPGSLQSALVSDRGIAPSAASPAPELPSAEVAGYREAHVKHLSNLNG